MANKKGYFKCYIFYFEFDLVPYEFNTIVVIGHVVL